MNIQLLTKDNWQQVKLKKIVREIKEVVTPSNEIFEKFVRPEDLEINRFFIQGWRKPDDVKSGQLFKTGDTLFARRSVSISQFKKRAALAKFSGICSNEITVLRCNEKHLLERYLTLILNTEKVWDYGLSVAVGSVSKRIKWNDLREIEFRLPPLEEQKRIADILYKIEDAIEQSEQQEKTLQDYRKGIIHQVFNTNESLGSLILNEDKITLCLGEAVDNINVSEQEPLEKGLLRFIGLEHIESENIKIEKWGEISSGITFTKFFKKGHVLFGKRRAYLKKAAVADFDGICSGDILVLEANEDKLLPELLPYIIQNDNFFDYAVTTSAGSLSPRTKWKDLSNFQLYLPDKNLQEKLVSFFKKFDNAIEQTKLHREKLIAFKKGLLNEIVA